MANTPPFSLHANQVNLLVVPQPLQYLPAKSSVYILGTYWAYSHMQSFILPAAASSRLSAEAFVPAGSGSLSGGLRPSNSSSCTTGSCEAECDVTFWPSLKPFGAHRGRKHQKLCRKCNTCFAPSFKHRKRKFISFRTCIDHCRACLKT